MKETLEEVGLNIQESYESLRHLTESMKNSAETLLNSVEQVLLESSISAQFNPDGYDTKVKKEMVLEKLQMVKILLLRNMVPDSDSDLKTVLYCIKHVEDGWALTAEIANYLNKIHKKYE